MNIAENDFGRSLPWPVLVLKPLQPRSRPYQIDVVRMSKFGDRQDKPTSPSPDQDMGELLEYQLRLAQELLDVRHAGIKAAVLEILGEHPPDPEGIEYVRSLARDLDTAREALVDATCRWHSFIFSRKRAQPVQKRIHVSVIGIRHNPK